MASLTSLFKTKVKDSEMSHLRKPHSSLCVHFELALSQQRLSAMYKLCICIILFPVGWETYELPLGFTSNNRLRADDIQSHLAKAAYWARSSLRERRYSLASFTRFCNGMSFIICQDLTSAGLSLSFVSLHGRKVY